MGKYPVFQSPALDEVERKMRPSEDFRHGFLGTDSRKLVQIIDEDQRALRELGLSDERIASELERLTTGNGVDGYSGCGSCAHSDSPAGASLNCILKARAAWSLFARIAEM